jgi:ABC-type dipeptide/oligopeptide/nickel transport system ATPase component
VNILEVKDLKTRFYAAGGIVDVVDGVSFGIGRGEVFGIVGESGSGKTMTALSILRLVPFPGRIAGGQVTFNGIDLTGAEEKMLKSIRGSNISMVFQEPAGSFNPVFTIGDQISEAVLAHHRMPVSAARDRAMEYLKIARIQDPDRVYGAYPHQLSGGTKQRAMIAMALVNSPDLVILDEPTTALDVTIQSEVLDTLGEIIREEGLSALFISHDLAVISRMCASVAVMRNGKIVETGSVKEVLISPKEAYTASLLESAKALS